MLLQAKQETIFGQIRMDTFHVFSYEQSIPRLNEAYLTTQDPVVRQRAENLFKLVQLDHVPRCIKDKDRRNKCRNEAMNCARISKQGLQSMANEEDRRIYRAQILLLAKFSGFFSVWMTIFHDDSETMKALIQAFPGTGTEIFRGKLKEFCMEELDAGAKLGDFLAYGEMACYTG